MWPIERADLFRYLVLYEYGGVYADVDVEVTRIQALTLILTLT